MAEGTSPKSLLFPGAHLLFVVAAAIGVYSFVNVARDGEGRRQCAATCLLKPNYAGSDRRAPGFDLKDIHGKTVNLDSYRGKVVVLNFWNTTCKFCLDEMPEIADLAKIVKPKDDVVVITIATDEELSVVKDTLRAILREEPPFMVLHDPDSKIVAGKYGTHMYPETWIIDKRGVIRSRFDGERAWSSPAVIELVDQLRNNGFCRVEVKEGRFLGDGERLCESISGG